MKLKTKTLIQKKADDSNQDFFLKLVPYILASFLLISIFLIITNIAEYLLTETFWFVDSLDQKLTTILLMLLLIIASLFDWQKLFKKEKVLMILIGTFFLITILGHHQYSKYYQYLQTYPKIKAISKDWGIPGSWVKIEGRNFGQNHQVGKIYLDSEEMLVKKWEDKEIIFEIPVIEVGRKKEIIVINYHDKQQTETFNFEIKEL